MKGVNGRDTEKVLNGDYGGYTPDNQWCPYYHLCDNNLNVEQCDECEVISSFEAQEAIERHNRPYKWCYNCKMFTRADKVCRRCGKKFSYYEHLKELTYACSVD